MGNPCLRHAGAGFEDAQKSEILERIYWIEKVVAVEKQVRFFYFF
jgi:hypothetical protein